MAFEAMKQLMKRLYCDKIDIHTHLINTPGAAERRMRADEILGFSACVLLPGAPERAGAEMSLLPQDACEIAKRYPDHFAWLCNLKPDGTGATRQKLIEYQKMGAKGVGEFSFRMRFDSPEMEHLFACLEELQLCFLFHMSPADEDPYYGILDDPRMPGLEGALRKFPGVKFIGHSQCFWFEMAKTEETDPRIRNSFPREPYTQPGRIPELMAKYPNLYCDLSANSGQNAMFRNPEYAVEFMNTYADRIFFGTDWIEEGNGAFRFCLDSFLDIQHLDGKLTDEAYQKICFKNARRVFFNG